MDQEYKEMLYASMFDELDRVQASKLYNDYELQKEALNVGGVLKGIKGGAKSLYQNPSGFMSNISSAWRGTKAKPGMAGWGKRARGVLRTDEGKLLATGLGGLGVAGAVAARPQPQQQVVVQR